MVIIRWVQWPRVARIGTLLAVAVLAAVMMAGPAEAHHRPDHPGGSGGTNGGNETATFDLAASGDLVGIVGVTKTVNGKESSIHNVPPEGED